MRRPPRFPNSLEFGYHRVGMQNFEVGCRRSRGRPLLFAQHLRESVMDYQVVDYVPFPLDLVYSTMRDELPELVAYLPDVKAITVEEREVSAEGQLRLVSRWIAEDRIPLLARAFIKPEHLGWLNFAEWNDLTHSVRYRLEMLFFKEAVEVNGQDFFSAASQGGCEVRMTGKLRIDLTKHPAVPRLLAKKMQSAAERLVLSLIQPNLAKVNRGIERHLAARGHEPVKR